MKIVRDLFFTTDFNFSFNLFALLKHFFEVRRYNDENKM